MKGSNPVNLSSIMIPTESVFDETVEEILKRPKYRHLRGGFLDFIQTIKDSINEWILKMLKKAFSNLSNAPAISERLSTIFMIVGLLIIIAIIIFVIIKINKTFDKKESIKEILGEKIAEGVTPRDLRNKGEEFIKKGDYRQGIRYDFIAVLLLMHEKNILYLDDTKTGEEIYDYLRRNKFEMAAHFKKLVKIFNASWYGHKPSNKMLYNEWNSIMDFIWNGVIGYEEKSQ